MTTVHVLPTARLSAADRPTPLLTLHNLVSLALRQQLPGPQIILFGEDGLLDLTCGTVDDAKAWCVALNTSWLVGDVLLMSQSVDWAGWRVLITARLRDGE